MQRQCTFEQNCQSEFFLKLCAVGFGQNKPEKKRTGWLDWWFNSRAGKKGEPRPLARTPPMRIEPKTFFANERTFLSWLHMAVSLAATHHLDFNREGRISSELVN